MPISQLHNLVLVFRTPQFHLELHSLCRPAVSTLKSPICRRRLQHIGYVRNIYLLDTEYIYMYFNSQQTAAYDLRILWRLIARLTAAAMAYGLRSHTQLW